MSERLIHDYLDLFEMFEDKPESQMRLNQILSDPLPLKRSRAANEREVPNS
jgi:hypothetical protein